MKPNLKYCIALLTFLSLLAIPLYPATSSQDTQSQAISIGPGVYTPSSSIHDETFSAPQSGDIPPMGYEIDFSVLQELKNQPFKAFDNLPTNEEDLAVSTLEPEPLAPVLHDDFEGLDDLNQPDGYLHRPPDPHIAAGLNHVGVMVNSEFAYYTKAGALVWEKSFQSHWSNVYTGNLPFDPRIAYDHHADRWIMVCIVREDEPTSWYLLSVSQGSNPLGGWWNWKLNGGLSYSGNTWADYPDLGFDGIAPASGGAIYITSNQFTWAGSFRTAMLNILPKSALYSGSGFSYWRAWGRTNNDGSQAFTLRTAWTHGNPGGEYLINSKSGGWDKVTLWRVNPTYPPNAVDWTRQATITIGSYSPPPDARQLGGSATLDTIDNRIYNVMYRNGHVYAAFTEAYNWGSGTVAAIRYLKINTGSNSLVLNVRYGADGQYYWFPAIYTDMSDNIVIVFARSSTTEYAGIRYTGRKTTDTSTQASALLKGGETYITGSRWGDYFGIAKDPVNHDKVWIYGEWAKDCPGVSSVWDWGTWIGKVSFWPVGHQPTYHVRISPFANVLHLHVDGAVIHGTEDYATRHNDPVLGTFSGDDFYFFIDFLKYDNGNPVYYEMGMIVGKISTLSGSLYRTADGMSWDGPTAVTLVSVTPDEPLTSGPRPRDLASPAINEPEPKGWPATYHVRVSPFVDVLHMHVDGAVIHGVNNASGFYSNQPVLGTFSGDNFYITTDWTRDDDGDPIYYEMGMIVGHVSTRSGSWYRTRDGMSVAAGYPVTLVSV